MAYYWWEYEDYQRKQVQDRERQNRRDGSVTARPPKRLLPGPTSQDDDEASESVSQ